jgi:hypothetical protein
MELDSVSEKHRNELEQQITQMLKLMRTIKIHESPIYADLQALEQELGEARRKHFDKGDAEFGNY